MSIATSFLFPQIDNIKHNNHYYTQNSSLTTNSEIMSEDLNNDNVLDRLTAITERTTGFAANVTQLLKIVPTAIALLKDTITQKDNVITAKDKQLAIKDDRIEELEDEVETLTKKVVDADRRTHNAVSATLYQKRKTTIEMEGKVEAKRVCIKQNKLIGKIISLATTFQAENKDESPVNKNNAVSDSESDNSDQNQVAIYKLHTFTNDITYPHHPKTDRRPFSITRTMINQDIEAGNVVENINICGSEFNEVLRKKQCTQAQFDQSSTIVGVMLGITTEFWMALQWDYCCKLLEDTSDPWRFIRVECIFEVWVHALFHFYDLETHEVLRIRHREKIPNASEYDTKEYTFHKNEYSKRYSNDLADRLEYDFPRKEYHEDLKW